MSKVFVIMYHFVKKENDSTKKYFNYLSINKFIKSIKYLKKNYEIINPTKKDKIFTNKKNKKKLCWLTFDDGYIDHYNNVVPILNKYKIQGTFFPVTSVLQKKYVLDANKIQSLVNIKKNDLIIKLIEKKFNQIYKKRLFKNLTNKIIFENISTRRFDDKKTLKIKLLLQKYLNKEKRKYIINYLFTKLIPKKDKKKFSEMYMNIKQLKEIKKQGHEIGCHSHSHEWLEIMNYKAAKSEICKSLNYIERKFNINKRKIVFCYPFGSKNDRIISILKNKNIKFAVSTKVNHFDTNKNNFLDIPRLDTNDYKKKF